MTNVFSLAEEVAFPGQNHSTARTRARLDVVHTIFGLLQNVKALVLFICSILAVLPDTRVPNCIKGFVFGYEEGVRDTAMDLLDDGICSSQLGVKVNRVIRVALVHLV